MFNSLSMKNYSNPKQKIKRVCGKKEKDFKTNKSDHHYDLGE